MLGPVFEGFETQSTVRVMNLVVKSHNPWRARIIWGGAVFVALVGGYQLYKLGLVQGGFKQASARQSKSELTARVLNLEEENAELRSQLALFEASREVDRVAYRQVEDSLSDLQDEIQKQREDLGFYKGIVSPEDGVSGLKIQSFRIRQGGDQNRYRIRLVLVQAMKHDRPIAGVVDLLLNGAREGRPVTYRLMDLSPTYDGKGGLEGETQIAFDFKYFQDFEHDVLIPDGLVPERVDIEVQPRGRTAQEIRESFFWRVSSG